MENNIIYDNCGFGFFEGFRIFEVYFFLDEFKFYFKVYEVEKVKRGFMGLSWDYDVIFLYVVLVELKIN